MKKSQDSHFEVNKALKRAFRIVLFPLFLKLESRLVINPKMILYDISVSDSFTRFVLLA